MVNRKTEITLSTAKIVYNEFFFLVKLAVNVLEIFEKFIDLSEFGLLLVVNSAVFVAYSKRNKEGLITLKNSVFLTVERLDSRLEGGFIDIVFKLS